MLARVPLGKKKKLSQMISVERSCPSLKQCAVNNPSEKGQHKENATIGIVVVLS
jgi:hypothetical protein